MLAHFEEQPLQVKIRGNTKVVGASFSDKTSNHTESSSHTCYAGKDMRRAFLCGIKGSPYPLLTRKDNIAHYE